MSVDETRCPSCGATVGEIVRVRYEGRLTHVRFLEPSPADGVGGADGQVEVDHVCGDQ